MATRWRSLHSSATLPYPLSRFRKMTDVDQPRPRDPRFAIWIGATAGLFVLALVVGFIWLPLAQRGADGLDLWSAICRAVGLPSGNARVSVPIAGQPASQVAWTTETRRRLAQGDAIAVARRLIDVGAPLRGIAPCASCHGPVGVTPGAPDLGGQQRAYLELQMQSFKDGTRRNDISEQMRSVARQLTSEEIAMLAAHY